jgi:hypothetical protein
MRFMSLSASWSLAIVLLIAPTAPANMNHLATPGAGNFNGWPVGIIIMRAKSCLINFQFYLGLGFVALFHSSNGPFGIT